MTEGNILLAGVTFLAISSFVGLIILSLLLGVQIQRGNELTEKNKELEKANQTLQANLDLMGGILAGWLKVEQRGLPPNARSAEISDLLAQLQQMHGMNVSGGTVNVTGDMMGGNKS